MTGFALYRLPYATDATIVQQTEGEPAELWSCQELNGRQGFVIAPFEVTSEQPILLIRPDMVQTVDLQAGAPQCVIPLAASSRPAGGNRTTYAIDFANFHSQLNLGTFQKIVLARCADEQKVTATPVDLFLRACERYPRMMIALVWTEKSGCWLTATPEILLEGKDDAWRTIALAGTMRLEGENPEGEGEGVTWSIKNIQEQRIVTTYITECLEQYTSDFREEGPHTVRAANLVHLRSDFTFSLPDRRHIGDLLHTLHPTPAVCGLPKRETFQFIVRHEHMPRRYYSGFMGMLNPDQETHLYVSLRCMNIEADVCHLYAGGGLLKDSTEEQEWNETEAKLETMRRIL